MKSSTVLIVKIGVEGRMNHVSRGVESKAEY